MPVDYRPATDADTPALFHLWMETIADMARRHGYPWSDSADPAAAWARWRPLFEHLALTAEQCWVAEQAGELLGYARAVFHDGVRELTEFFVRPGQQAAGVGRELLGRAFPAAGARRRIIIATNDLPALARYLRTGLSVHCPIYNFRRRPEAVRLPSDLEPTAMNTVAEAARLEILAGVDRATLGYRRDAEHQWWVARRDGWLYYRAGQAVAYGYHADDSGPFAALEAGDLPALLAAAEAAGHARGQADLGFEVPLVNRAAVAHLLGRGYRLEPFFAYFMSDQPLARLQNYVLNSPPFTL